MKLGFRSVGLTLAATVISASVSFASTLPEGAFRGNSPLVNAKQEKAKENDFMSMLIKKDEKNSDSYYVILAEYTVQDKEVLKFIKLGKIGKLTPKSNELALVNWVPRMYIYRANKVSDLEFDLKPLMVTASGDIDVNSEAVASHLKLNTANSIEKATLTRLNEKNEVAEVVTFNPQRTLRGNSTWEGYVPGKYFGTTNSTGDDYFKKTVNTDISTDGIVNFNRDTVSGKFKIEEKLPKMFTLSAADNVNKGKETVEGKIAVFVDIVNWKSFGLERFTTEELLIINPNDASDVGFYYERHYNIKDEEKAKAARAKK
ncbi:MAG: hypothetical protein JNL11_20025 [Bdellovibrionaceae bacterium]|nr:hypothetical protein [Pseudobdellovibrionaceae bacterium]